MALRNLATRKTLSATTQAFRQQLRGLQTATLPDLPYDYGALEPAISGEIMQLHHQKHHQAYVTNYNKALEQLHEAISKGDASAAVKLQSAIKFNGGGSSLSLSVSVYLQLYCFDIVLDCVYGCIEHWFSRSELVVFCAFPSHINHSIFWKNLAPTREGGGEPPKSSLGWEIDNHFGSLDALIQKMSAEGAAVQGSGWVWLGLDKELKHLVVETTSNQDPLVTVNPNLVPLLGIDVWEHAYYLQYKNVRPDYLKNIWKVVNWKYACEVYQQFTPLPASRD
nr:superoxide dismutase [Mn], mitochondrial [Ipomoea batatas]